MKTERWQSISQDHWNWIKAQHTLYYCPTCGCVWYTDPNCETMSLHVASVEEISAEMLDQVSTDRVCNCAD